MGVTCAILVCLFIIQPFQDSKDRDDLRPCRHRMAALQSLRPASPQLAMQHYRLKSFQPTLPFTLSASATRRSGWGSLGGLLLAIHRRGPCFADLGAFSFKRAPLSLLANVSLPPCLLSRSTPARQPCIAIDEAQVAYSNPFFYTLPHWLVLFQVKADFRIIAICTRFTLTDSIA